MTDNELIEQVAQHISAISSLLGIKVTESNQNTPKRVAKMYCNEFFKNREGKNLDELTSQMTTFPVEEIMGICPEPIKVSGIKFCSMCEHHWLPFMGYVDVEYVPSDRIIGLSKIPRVVEYFSQRPQLQERLTADICDYLTEILHPVSLKVTITSTHTCVMCRGAKSECNTTTVKRYTKSGTIAY